MRLDDPTPEASDVPAGERPVNGHPEAEPLTQEQRQAIRDVELAGHYSAGVSSVTGAPHSLDPGQFVAMRRVVTTHAKGLRLGKLDAWLLETGAEYARATLAKAEFQSGFSAACFKKWLDSGRPGAAMGRATKTVDPKTGYVHLTDHRGLPAQGYDPKAPWLKGILSPAPAEPDGDDSTPEARRVGLPSPGEATAGASGQSRRRCHPTTPARRASLGRQSRPSPDCRDDGLGDRGRRGRREAGPRVVHLGRRSLRVGPASVGGVPMSLRVRPSTLAEANAFVAQHHRHHPKVVGYRFALAAIDGERLCGVVIVGRPVARMIDHVTVAEVTRLCTDGTRNACSMLYQAARRTWQAMGGVKVITYTLPEEGGASLRAAGWVCVGPAGGGSWSCPSRPRTDKAPTQLKLRWEAS